MQHGKDVVEQVFHACVETFQIPTRGGGEVRAVGVDSVVFETSVIAKVSRKETRGVPDQIVTTDLIGHTGSWFSRSLLRSFVE